MSSASEPHLINLKLSLREKHKFGGYRGISFHLADKKGGDFVENEELSVVLLEKRRGMVVAESERGHLEKSPDGLSRVIEFGVRNYSPGQFVQ